MRQFAILAFVAAAVLCVSPAALCDDLEDLKAAHEAVYKALDGRSIDGLLAMLHEEYAAFLPNNPFPVRKPMEELLKTVWPRIERVTRTMLDPQYVVVGDTGIVWGHVRRTQKLKDGPGEIDYHRGSFTYVK